MTIMNKFDKERHVRYFAYTLRTLPEPYVKLDTNRLTLVHFATHALDMLGVWDDETTLEAMRLSKTSIIEWIYSLQLTSPAQVVNADQVGFKGGKYLGDDPQEEYNQGHVAMTYTALCTLRTLGDDLQRVDKEGIVHSLRALQRSDGSFQCCGNIKSEHDMRFLYCACAVSYMLNDWSGVDKDRAVAYIKSCRSFDGAIALIPGQVNILLY
jgi:geranylgeranyl transferase type-1 subunit beta